MGRRGNSARGRRSASGKGDASAPSSRRSQVLPEEIVALRERAGLSRTALARHLGVSPTSVQKWENGGVPGEATQLQLRQLCDDPPPNLAQETTSSRGQPTWEVVTPEEIEAFREREGLSYYRLATERLGVSPGFVNNWLKKGTAVASRRMQQRIRRAIERPEEGAEARSSGEGARIAATGSIVSGFLRSHGSLAPEAVLDLVRAVRRALTAP